jgi:hypothetical protein
MRKTLVLLLGLAVLAALAVPALGLGGGDGRKVLDAKVLAPVTEPYTGATNSIRGLAGGGLPWQLASGSADLRAGGQLHVEIEGLVLAQRAPVPANLQGTNPFPQFKAIVSCLTTPDGIAATTDNISTELFDVTPTGDGELDTSVSLPSPCFAPIVFVTAPAGAWFAISGS